MVLPKLRNAWRRRTSAVSGVCTLALVGAGLVGVTAAPAHATTALDLAYVVDRGDASVRVVDVATSTIVGTIPVGFGAEAIVVSPDKRTAYVVSYGGALYGNTVSVIDAATSTVTHTIPICGVPGAAALKPDGSQLWVACGSGVVMVIDTATATVARTIPAEDPVDLAFSPDGSAVYERYDPFQGGSPALNVIDSATGSVTATIVDRGFDFGLVVSPDGSKLLVGQQGSDSLAVVDTASDTVTSTIPMGGMPGAGVLNPAGTAVYYCVSGIGIEAVDLASRAITRTLTVPCGELTSEIGSLAFAPDGNTLYASRMYSGLSVIDVRTGAVTATFPTGPQLGFPVATGFVRAPIVPAVTAVSPAQGPEVGGSTVVITGGPFRVGGVGGVTAVSFGGVPAASFSVDSDTQITAVAPAQTARTVDVTVTNDNGTSVVSAADQFTYTALAPTISTLTPASGVSSGGTTVVITGTHLFSTREVFFGGTAAASFTVDSDSQVTAVTRAQTNGTVNVTVTNSAGISTPVPGNQFTFFSPVPVVTSVSPAAGPIAGGDTVTITGMRFTGTFRVTFGGVAVPFTRNSDSQITVVTPAWSSLMTPAAGSGGAGGPGGVVDVQVTTDVDTSVISGADHYEYGTPA